MSGGTLPTVLVVDDEPFSVASMRMALEDDFNVLEATDAEAAWRLLEENWVQVVVSDQRMPGRTGVELLSDVRDRWPETVRIIVTGYTESSDMIDAINKAGIYQFITKPWHPEQFLMAVRNAARLFELSREHEPRNALPRQHRDAEDAGPASAGAGGRGVRQGAARHRQPSEPDHRAGAAICQLRGAGADHRRGGHRQG